MRFKKGDHVRMTPENGNKTGIVARDSRGIMVAVIPTGCKSSQDWSVNFWELEKKDRSEKNKVFGDWVIYESGYWEINKNGAMVTLEPRPSYCDRGRWVAKIFPHDKIAYWIDEADAWPRYYFDLERAKLEIEAFLEFRKREAHNVRIKR